MKRHIVLIISVVLMITLTLAVGSLVFAQSPSDSQPDGATAQNSQESGLANDDSNPNGNPEVIIPDKFIPSQQDLNRAGTLAGKTLYFTPQDENTSTTVLFLYNTDSTTATVGLTTYELDGTTYIDTNIAVPPNSLVRICGDEVDTISWTWQDVVLVNMTTASTYAVMTLPGSVKYEGYVVWNGGVTYDPLQIAPTLPIRFLTSSAIMLPLINR
jgi:hypothetical protein